MSIQRSGCSACAPEHGGAVVLPFPARRRSSRVPRWLPAAAAALALAGILALVAHPVADAAVTDLSWIVPG